MKPEDLIHNKTYYLQTSSGSKQIIFRTSASDGYHFSIVMNTNDLDEQGFIPPGIEILAKVILNQFVVQNSVVEKKDFVDTIDDIYL